MRSQTTSVKSAAYQLVIWQLLITMGLALVIGLLQGLKNGGSALLGGLAYGVPTLIFVWRTFRKKALQNVQRFVVLFFAGEAAKLLLSATLFVLIVNFLPVHVVSQLIGYIGAIMAFWLVAFLYLNSHPGATL